MSMSTFVALCLLALPPSDCPGGCYPQHHLPLLGRHVLPSLDGEFDWSGDYGDLMPGDGFVVSELFEPAAPVVLLRSLEVGAADQQRFLASSDRPAYWTAVPFGPLSVEVQVQMGAAEIAPAEPLEYIVLLLDGKPVENNRYLTRAQPAPVPSADGQLRMAYIFNFPCPAPGKHIVQARYKTASLWSRISPPLHFEVRLPDPPRIVAMSDAGGVPAPVRRAGLISITKPEVIVRLANVSQNASVVAYLDGKPISTALAQESCCRTLRLQGHITPGIHSLRLRTVTSGGSCSVTSEPSDEVVFQYYDEDVYLLRPRNRCKNCPPPANVQARYFDVTPHDLVAATTSLAADHSLALPDNHQPSVRLAVIATEAFAHPLRPAVFVNSPGDWAAAFRFASYAADSAADEPRNAEEYRATIDAAITQTTGNCAAAEAALARASAAADDAAKQAAAADEAAWQATKDAEAAEAQAQQTRQLVQSAQAARTATIHWAAEAAERAYQARVSKEKEANAARRARAESHQVQAETNRDSAIRQQELAGASYDRAAQEVRNADAGSRKTSAHAATASQDATRSRKYAKTVAEIAREVEAAVHEARVASAQVQQAARTDDWVEVQEGKKRSFRAMQQAVGRSGATATDQHSAQTAREAAAAQAANAKVHGKAATAARQRAAAETEHAKVAAQNAEGHAVAAAHHATEARRFQVADEAIVERRNAAELEQAVRALQSTRKDIEVQQARDAAEFAQGLATKEWTQTDARINLTDSNDSITRAQAVQGPPSPFYFASTAYFPMRQFGVQGEALDREGAVIYEDMAFSFDREGNYNVRFTIGTPAVPTTIQLRFLIQPCPGGPWYTVTLEPIGFPPTKVADGKYTPSIFRNHVVRGNSEILRRCYGEMGQNATIRREGTARFGFGLAGLSQNRAG